MLDLEQSFAGLSAAAAGPAPLAAPARERSRLRFAAEALVSDPERQLAARIWLRDASARLSDPDLARLALHVTGARLAQPLERLGPGLFGFSLTSPAPALADRARVELRLDERPLLSAELPVLGEVERRATTAGGGCNLRGVGVGAATRHASPGVPAVLLALLVASRRRPRPQLRSRPDTP
jgi:hypothetical protein